MTCVDKPSLPCDLCIFRSACDRKPASHTLFSLFLPSVEGGAEREPESHLPIPDEPRKRKTRGCSSSYQPFSFLLMAAERGGGGRVSFHLTGLLTVCGGRPRGGCCPRNHHDRVGMRGGSETFGGEKTEPETSTKIPTMPLSTPHPTSVSEAIRRR